jgi:preprotein translocase subunit Sec61beta
MTADERSILVAGLLVALLVLAVVNTFARRR